MVYGGTIRAGCTPTHPKLDIISAFEAYGKYVRVRVRVRVRLFNGWYIMPLIYPLT